MYTMGEPAKSTQTYHTIKVQGIRNDEQSQLIFIVSRLFLNHSCTFNKDDAPYIRVISTNIIILLQSYYTAENNLVRECSFLLSNTVI